MGKGRWRVGVVALQGDVREHAHALTACGADPIAVRWPSDLDGVQALVLPGGESTTMSLLLRSSGLDRALEARIADGLPVLGTCAGMILLATDVVDGRPDQLSLGAIDLTIRRNAFGRQLQSFETDLEVLGIDGGPMHAIFIRAPLVVRVGAGVDVLAAIHAEGYVATGEPQAAKGRPVVCRHRRVTVAAFHPELAGDVRLHQLLLCDIEGD